MIDLRFIRLFLAAALLLLTVPVQSMASAKVAVPEQEIKAVVERYLTEKLAGRGWEFSIRQLSTPPDIKVGKGVRDLELIAPANWDGWGATSAALIIRVNGAVERNLSIRVVVEARTAMLVAKRQLITGTVLTADDLQLQVADVGLAGGEHIARLDDAIGKRLRSTVRGGAAIKSSQLVTVPVITAGQLVTIVAENAGIRITVSGRARSAGVVGDLIRVQNLTSNRELNARIVDASTVEIGF